MAKYTTDAEKKYVESAKLENIISDGLNSGKFGHDAVEILSEIYALESVDVAPVRHGKWIETGYYSCFKNPIYLCSACHKEVEDRYIKNHEFCLHCGAKMDLED